MRRTGRLEPQHDLAQVRRYQPQRDLATQYAAIRIRAPHALSGDDQHDAGTFRLGDAQETDQRIVSVGLGQAVQIDAGIDPGTPADDPLPQSPIETRKWWNRLFA